MKRYNAPYRPDPPQYNDYNEYNSPNGYIPSRNWNGNNPYPNKWESRRQNYQQYGQNPY